MTVHFHRFGHFHSGHGRPLLAHVQYGENSRWPGAAVSPLPETETTTSGHGSPTQRAMYDQTFDPKESIELAETEHPHAVVGGAL